MNELADHGITLPPNMQGLNDEQISELKLRDEWAEKCEPSGGHVFNKDDIGRRNCRGAVEFDNNFTIYNVNVSVKILLMNINNYNFPFLLNIIFLFLPCTFFSPE